MSNILYENGSPVYAIVNGKMVEVQEVRHGRWTQHDDAYYAGGGYWECSCCKWHISNFIFIEDARYCPNCGAKMDEVDKNGDEITE